ncbi:hypothetical protein [Lysobacter gummosus]|uniref:hypothetical protein n=1 Tax=Lysobacter gummosus TaxID=262324 RepID=UPI0036449130
MAGAAAGVAPAAPAVRSCDTAVATVAAIKPTAISAVFMIRSLFPVLNAVAGRKGPWICGMRGQVREL